MTEEQFIKLSLECFRNAESLHRDALLLQQYDSPRAVSLAIIGCEEFAKSVVYALGAIFPEQRDMLAKNMRRLKLHEIKHMINQYAEAAQIENFEGWLILRQETGLGRDPHGRLMDMLRHLKSSGLSNLVTSKDGEKNFGMVFQTRAGLKRGRCM